MTGFRRLTRRSHSARLGRFGLDPDEASTRQIELFDDRAVFGSTANLSVSASSRPHRVTTTSGAFAVDAPRRRSAKPMPLRSRTFEAASQGRITT